MTPTTRSLESAINSALATNVVSAMFKRETERTPEFVGENARYAIRDLLGDGCSGSVYLARDARYCDDHHEELVAVKVLRGEQSGEEARRVRYVKHPNVVQSLDFGEDFIVFEYIPCGSLETLDRPVRPREAARLVAEIADGVQAAHNRGLIHRDLKPANVLLDLDGTPKVADFGIAVLDTHVGGGSGELTGNRAFMAPELFTEGRSAITTKIDIYALGCLLYWLITDSLPHGGTVAEVEQAHESGHAPRLSGVGRDLAAICTRAMAIDPFDRYDTAAQLAADLRAWRAHQPIEWRRPGIVRKSVLLCRRRPKSAILTGAAAIIFLIGVGATAQLIRQTQEAQGRHADRFEEVREGLRTRAWRDEP